jgi:hypothetical protein
VIGPKVAIWRSRPYRMFVASQPCFGCGIEGYSQCAHENAGKGRGLKSGDDRTFPLCATRPGKIGCHVEHDQCIDQSREMRDEDALVYVARMQARARAAGWALPMPAASGLDADARCDNPEKRTA